MSREWLFTSAFHKQNCSFFIFKHYKKIHVHVEIKVTIISYMFVIGQCTYTCREISIASRILQEIVQQNRIPLQHITLTVLTRRL